MTASPAPERNGTAPAGDEDSGPWWTALAEHRILLQRCLDCGLVRFPPMPGCPRCGGAHDETVESAGTGVVYSWITIRHPLAGLSAADVPRTIATVELAEGCRLVGRLLTEHEPAIDDPVRPVFLDGPTGTELAFEPGTVD
jgi:3-oxo-4,17-pregnadiene-20-carboxyl-CoA hydratase alpha subunit